MIAIEKLESLDDLAQLKRDYVSSLSSPLDGMWEAFVGKSQYWLVRIDERWPGTVHGVDTLTLSENSRRRCRRKLVDETDWGDRESL